jgi:hypothetical protein
MMLEIIPKALQCSSLLSWQVGCPFHHKSCFNSVNPILFNQEACFHPCVNIFCSLEKVGIEKKVITGVSPHNSDIQFEVMLERRVLQRLCVQKILVDTPMKDKLDKVKSN